MSSINQKNVPAIKIYTYYDIEFEKTIVTIVHMIKDKEDYHAEDICLFPETYITNGNITKNIIEIFSDSFIKLAIEYGGFYIDEKYIGIKEIDEDNIFSFNFNGKRYVLI